MAMMKCPACGKAARKWRIVLLLGGAKGLRGRKVCAECADGGVIVVAQRVAPVVQADKAERRAQKDVLAPFIRNLEARLKAIGKQNWGNDREMTAWQGGQSELLENVIAMLKEGRA